MLDMRIKKMYVAKIRYSTKEQFEAGITGGAFEKQIEVHHEDLITNEMWKMHDEEGLYPLLADVTIRYVAEYKEYNSTERRFNDL
jgi:hypothetical protein